MKRSTKRALIKSIHAARAASKRFRPAPPDPVKVARLKALELKLTEGTRKIFDEIVEAW